MNQTEISKFTNRNYLTQNQYKTPVNLDARIALHKRFSTNPYDWFNWLFDEIAFLPTHTNILELGCGSGELWKECMVRVPASWDLTLTDLSTGMLESARSNLVATGRTIKCEVVDAQKIPYPDGTFDAVLANHMLYHVPNRRLALQEIRRVLKRGGVFFSTTVGDNHMHKMYEWILQISGGKQGMFTLQFTLENGRRQLKEYFSSTRLSRYSNDLWVTDVGVISTYIRSVILPEDLLEEELQKIENELQNTIDKNHGILILKDTGLFKSII